MFKSELIFSLILLVTVISSCGNSKTKSETETVSSEKIETVEKPMVDMDLFFNAALEGNLAFIQNSLDQGVNVNAIDADQRTALMLAAFNGHQPIVKLLLDKGADVKMVDNVNRTALMFASTGPFNATVVELIKAGSDVNATDNHENWTPVMFAAGEGQLEVVKTLVANGADISMLDVDGESALDFARSKGHQNVVGYLQSLSK